MKAAKQTITVKLEKHPTMEAIGITVPFDVEAVFGSKRVPVKAIVNGEEYRGTIVRMAGKYLLGIPEISREAAGTKVCDNIVVTLENDTVERTADIPPDLARELKKDRALPQAWEAPCFTIRKENSLALEEAKHTKTRVGRLQKTLAVLRERAAN